MLVFELHKILDFFLPTKYHSVPVNLLGIAMVKDSELLLPSSNNVEGNDHHTVARVARFTYEDYLQIVNEDYNQKLQSNSNTDSVKEEI